MNGVVSFQAETGTIQIMAEVGIGVVNHFAIHRSVGSAVSATEAASARMNFQPWLELRGLQPTIAPQLRGAAEGKSMFAEWRASKGQSKSASSSSSVRVVMPGDKEGKGKKGKGPRK